MKHDRPLSELAGKVLARDAEAAPEPSPETRARAIDAIARTMRDRKQRKRAWRRLLGGAAVAASIAVAIGIGRGGRHGERVASHGAPEAPAGTVAPAAASFVRGSPALLRHGSRRELHEGAPLERGDRLIVERGSRTTVALRGGSYLVLEEPAQLVLASTAPTTMFNLESGSVRADVAKLTGDERFLIRTADAEVEVHGTSFEVSHVPPNPNCGGGTKTRVKVREGVVAVRAGGTETFVRAGEAWPHGCAASDEVPGTTPPASAGTTKTPPTPAKSAKQTLSNAPLPVHDGAPTSDDVPASDLSKQNDQFERAIARKRAGDATGAIAVFEELLARYPSSHLAQSARAERMKLLREVNRDRARLAARDYLERYPTGFARSDAELILAGE